MTMRAFWKRLALALTYLVLIAGTAAMAAQVTSQSRGSYQRITFAFGSEANVTANSSGSTLTLNFNQSIGSADGIAAKLPGYAKSVQLSADGKTLTIALTKPFRTRHFKSGNSVGVDLIGEPDAVAEQPASEKEPLLTTKAEPEKPKTEPKKVVAPEKIPFAKAEKPKPTNKKLVPAPIAPVEQAILTTKAADAEPKPVVAAIAKPSLATIAPTLAPLNAAPTTAAETPVSAPEAPAAAADPILSTKTPVVEPTPTAEKPAEPAKAPELAPAPAPTAVMEKPAPASSFLVGTTTKEHNVSMHFPFTNRTAAAVFERARDIWVVFSQPEDVNARLLRTLMPKGVADVTQFNYKGATVLRFTTDGTLHASLSQPSGSQSWDVAISSNANKATLDVPISSESGETGRELIVGAFDSSEPLKFYDPRIGDLLVIIPIYEAGRGVIAAKRYPEISIFSSAQGVALTSTRDDLKLGRNRAGHIFTAPGGLAISDSLTTLTQQSKPVPGSSTVSDVMMPYDKWYIAPSQFPDMAYVLLLGSLHASDSTKAESLQKLAGLYLGQGMAQEAKGYLQLVHDRYPEYYVANKLALLDAVCAFMMEDTNAAAKFIAAPELNELGEAQPWREAIALYAPVASTVQQMMQSMDEAGAPVATPAPPVADDDLETGAKPAQPGPVPQHATFKFLKWNKPYIRFYPPRIRQKLAIIAADAYLRDGLDDKALQTYETLNRDGILGPIKLYAELATAEVSVHHNDTQKALSIYKTLQSQREDPYVATRARFGEAMLLYRMGKQTTEETIDSLERMRLGWRGDALAHDILTSLAQLYKDAKQFDGTLRTQRILLEDYPAAPDVLQLSADTSQLYQDVFVGGLGDDMPPLKALALFYEFKDLTPVGEKGDEIIQRLADRLAGVDLLSQAIQLLEHQVKNRLVGEPRARVGARLALLQLLNQQPQQALDSIQATNYGSNDAELQIERQELAAEALSKLGKNPEALSMLYNDTTRKGALLRLDILWAMNDWPNVINRAEDILSARPSLTATLSEQETDVLMKLALAYAFEGDANQLRYLRDYFTDLLPDNGYKQAFNYITNDTAPPDTDDINLITQQISNNESFLKTFREKIAAGKLSETMQ